MSDASKYKGRCYLEMGIPNSALLDFTAAIKNDEKNAELYSKGLLISPRLFWSMLLVNGTVG
jgi:hypothetical protein